ncbi:hypothetical protein PR048_033698 [Dryococelus australis]|uniref:Maturase R n=1 Tax=Dryococelus australis TaxID=614101 RepID=A0ABQ9G541_9NEOP|nr:hypothetical protein PR048_033698 [Dryococelus australis]
MNWERVTNDSGFLDILWESFHWTNEDSDTIRQDVRKQLGLVAISQGKDNCSDRDPNSKNNRAELPPALKLKSWFLYIKILYNPEIIGSNPSVKTVKTAGLQILTFGRISGPRFQLLILAFPRLPEVTLQSRMWGRGSVVVTLRRTHAVSHPNFRLWETCRTMAGFPGDLPFPSPLHSGAAPYSPRFTLIGSQDLDTAHQWSALRKEATRLVVSGGRVGLNPLRSMHTGALSCVPRMVVGVRGRTWDGGRGKRQAVFNPRETPANQ